MRQLIAAAVLTLILLPTGAPAASIGVKDDAGVFSKSVIAQANDAIKTIKQKYAKDVLVETLPAVPDDLQVLLDAAALKTATQPSEQKAAAKDEVWTRWMDERGRAAGIDGVYVLMIPSSAWHTQIYVDQKTLEKGFTRLDRNNLLTTLMNARKTVEKEKGVDPVLAAGVNYIQTALHDNLADWRSWFVRLKWPWLAAIGGLLVALWIVAKIFARRSRRPVYPPPQQMPMEPEADGEAEANEQE